MALLWHLIQHDVTLEVKVTFCEDRLAKTQNTYYLFISSLFFVNFLLFFLLFVCLFLLFYVVEELPTFGFSWQGNRWLKYLTENVGICRPSS